MSNIKHLPTICLPEKDEGGYAWSSWTWWGKTTFLFLEEFGAQGGVLMVRMGTTNCGGGSYSKLHLMWKPPRKALKTTGRCPLAGWKPKPVIFIVEKLWKILKIPQNKQKTDFNDFLFLATDNYPIGKSQLPVKVHVLAFFCREET